MVIGRGQASPLTRRTECQISLLHGGAPRMALGTFLFQFNLRAARIGFGSVILSGLFLRTLVALRSHLQGRLRRTATLCGVREAGNLYRVRLSKDAKPEQITAILAHGNSGFCAQGVTHPYFLAVALIHRSHIFVVGRQMLEEVVYVHSA